MIPFALALTFGAIVGDIRQGRALLLVMLGYVLVGTLAVYAAEAGGNPLHLALGVDPALGNMEGKEVRFGMALTALFTATTTGASCGAVNAMFDSFTPLGGLVPLFLIQLGEVLPGGAGSGLYGILVFALLAVFVAGLMVGRTPEYLGKKVQAREIKLAMLAVLVLPAAILGFAAVSLVLPVAVASIPAAGPHGLSEMLYAYTSAAGNNGSAFGGLTADTPWLNTTLGIAMLLGRFAYVVPVMAIAGSLAAKVKAAEGPGTFPTHGPLFAGPAGGGDPDPRRAAVHARPRARPAGRTFLDARRQDLLRRNPMDMMIPQGTATRRVRVAAFTDRRLLGRAALDALRKLNPAKLIRNPVIFVTEVVAILVTLLAVLAAVDGAPWGFQAGIGAWLWLTVVFATFAEAVAEGRGRAQAESLRRARGDARAKLLLRADDRTLWQPRGATDLKVGDLVLVEAGDLVPSDGEIVEGIASVNEAAVTGESAPVIRESGGDRSAVTGGTLVVSDWLVVRITAAPGSTFLDRMIALVEGASRQKTPNEIALDILLAGMTIIFLIAVATLGGLRQLGRAAALRHRAGGAAGDPDPDDDRRAALGHRHRRHGPAGALQRAGDQRPGGGGRRRRRRAAAGQDRHHHLRQPPGGGLRAGAGRGRAGAGGGGGAGQPRRRDAGGAVHPRLRAGDATASPRRGCRPRPRWCPSPRRPGSPASIPMGAAIARARWAAWRRASACRSRRRWPRRSTASRARGRRRWRSAATGWCSARSS